jgi:hypothetical protein
MLLEYDDRNILSEKNVGLICTQVIGPDLHQMEHKSRKIFPEPTRSKTSNLSLLVVHIQNDLLLCL